MEVPPQEVRHRGGDLPDIRAELLWSLGRRHPQRLLPHDPPDHFLRHGLSGALERLVDPAVTVAPSAGLERLPYPDAELRILVPRLDRPLLREVSASRDSDCLYQVGHLVLGPEGVNQRGLFPVRQGRQADALLFFYEFARLLEDVLLHLQPVHVLAQPLLDFAQPLRLLPEPFVLRTELLDALRDGFFLSLHAPMIAADPELCLPPVDGAPGHPVLLCDLPHGLVVGAQVVPDRGHDLATVVAYLVVAFLDDPELPRGKRFDPDFQRRIGVGESERPYGGPQVPAMLQVIPDGRFHLFLRVAASKTAFFPAVMEVLVLLVFPVPSPQRVPVVRIPKLPHRLPGSLVVLDVQLDSDLLLLLRVARHFGLLLKV